MPFHKGHLHCLDYALSMCDKVVLLLVTGGKQEKEILQENDDVTLRPEYRINHIREIVERYEARYPNRVVFATCDVSMCRTDDGEEDWDKETPIVLAECYRALYGDRRGIFDAVFGSELEYAAYFNRAYPWATYEVVDVGRSDVPISATKIRAMSKNDAQKWIV